MKIIKEFSGHSGCKVFLAENDGGTFVRKISADENYNKRLKMQMRKQRLFGEIFAQSGEQNAKNSQNFKQSGENSQKFKKGGEFLQNSEQNAKFPLNLKQNALKFTLFAPKILGHSDILGENADLSKGANFGKNANLNKNSAPNENSLFYYDMEFVLGSTLSSCVQWLQGAEIRALVESLVELFFSKINADKIKQKANASEIFGAKIANLQGILQEKFSENSSIFKHKPRLKTAFKILKNFDFSQVEHSFCHGDLTLENIIICWDFGAQSVNFQSENPNLNDKSVNFQAQNPNSKAANFAPKSENLNSPKNPNLSVNLALNSRLAPNQSPQIKIYLIDFLDSFFNSWQLDAAKLLQDLEFFWAFRFERVSTSKALKLHFAREVLTTKILSLKNGKQRLCVIYHLVLLNFLRIFPYAKDENTANFLQNAVSKLTQKIRKDFQ